MNFTPHYGSTVSATSSAGATSVNVQPGARALLITNVGTRLVFVRVRNASAPGTASAADLPIPANTQRVIAKASADSVANGESVVSIFSDGAGSTVYITSGSLVEG